MSIKNHIITNATQKPSPNHSGTITPKFIVMHYTATWSAESAIRTLTRKGSGVSAHMTIDTDGTIYQHVPLNKKAWHAGASLYNGYSGLNSYAIGIEIVNPGYQKKAGDKYQDAYGVIRSSKQIGDMVESPHSRVGSGTFYWPVYTKAQIATLEKITADIIDTYNILDIVSHEEIDTRGWKTDPGPAFPMKLFKQLLPNRKNDSDQFEVIATSLNVRSGPGSHYSIIGKVSKNDVVEIEGKSGVWARIDDNGWVHSSYLRMV